MFERVFITLVGDELNSNKYETIWEKVRKINSEATLYCEDVAFKDLKDGFLLDTESRETYEEQIRSLNTMKIFAKAKEKATFVTYRMKKMFKIVYYYTLDFPKHLMITIPMFGAKMII